MISICAAASLATNVRVVAQLERRVQHETFGRVTSSATVSTKTLIDNGAQSPVWSRIMEPLYQTAGATRANFCAALPNG